MLFFSESGCKDRNFQALLPNVFGSFFFIFLFSGHFRSERKKKKLEVSILPITLTMSIIQPCFSCKAGAKVGHFTIRTKYMILFFSKKMKRFL